MMATSGAWRSSAIQKARSAAAALCDEPSMPTTTGPSASAREPCGTMTTGHWACIAAASDGRPETEALQGALASGADDDETGRRPRRR